MIVMEDQVSTLSAIGCWISTQEIVPWGAYVGAINRVIVRLAADVVDYSRLVEADEEGTLKRLDDVTAMFRNHRI